MKKKIVISIIVALILVIGIVSFILFNNSITTTITLDINPSIEINLTRNKKIKNVVALNDAAKKVLDKELKGESLKEALKWIMNRSIDLNYIDGETAVVLVMIDGNYNQDALRRFMANPLGERKRELDMIVIDKISKEDKELSKKNNISLAKAHYINELAKERNIKVEEYINKSVREIKETKDTGNTCPEGYNLEGDFCIKEIDRVEGIKGEICPRGYRDYKGKCYEESNIIDTDNYSCREGKLEGTKCIIERTSEAIPSKYTCSSGTLKRKSEVGIRSTGEDDYVCADTSNGKEPTLRCLTNPGHIMMNGKCYNGPAPTINGGCPNGDSLINGGCYSLDSYDQYVCPNGSIYHKSQNSVPEYCPETIKTTKPVVSEYKCEGNVELNGTKCITKESYDAERERTCKEGFTLVDNQMCINENNIKEYIEGYRCDKENTRLEDNICVVLDIKEANRVE